MRKLSGSKKSRPATAAESNYIKNVLDGVPKEKLPEADFDNMVLYEPVATEEDPFGYAGRMVLMEQLIVSEDIQKFIRGDVMDIDMNKIEETAKKNGMLTLEQKGVIMALKGETTLEEVSRVI